MTEVTAPALPKIGLTTTIPESARAGGRTGGTNIYQDFMFQMPPPVMGKGKDAKMTYSWFFVPSEVPDTITDEGERDKAAKANATKLVNRFTSISRRIKKNNSATHDFTFRKSRDPNVEGDIGAWGLVVYRVPPGMDKGGPVKKAA